MKQIEVITEVAKLIANKNFDLAKNLIADDYPFNKISVSERKYTDKEKMEQFVRDGFIDRYSGERLVNPGMLRVLSEYFPSDFPYHPHWKMNECHIAYWELIPTIDHVTPIALGGIDSQENWATTSMLHNAVKSNWTLAQLNWTLHKKGDYKEWDGLTELFVQLINSDHSLLQNKYIRKWYKISTETIKFKTE